MFKIVDRVSNLLGLGTARSRPAPEYQLLTDGLMITASTAVAWFELGTSNTDLAGEGDVDAELDHVIRAVSPLLQGHDCHLKLLWDRVDGQQYLEELDHPATAWDDTRADWLDEYEVPTRRLLLGVTLDNSRQDDGKAFARQQAAAALGLPLGKVTNSERDWLHGKVRELGRALGGTPWTIALASTETLSWAISREMHRDTARRRRSGTIAGAGIAQLTNGKVIPYGDHLEVVDAEGQTVRYVAVLALAAFPQAIETPGEQEWLRTISTIQRVDQQGQTVPVIADASVRFQILGQNDARKRIENTRTLAKEQRLSASKHSAGETSEEIAETEETMIQVKRDLERAGLRLVEAHPRIVVSEPTLEDCRAAVQAVMTHYDSVGITAYRADEEQRELWLESLPGDILRVTDLGHVLDAEAFFGAWWWGGTQIGDGAGKPMVAIQTGSTPGLVRFSLNGAAGRGDSTTVAFLGKSGRGKTTALQLCLMDAVTDGRTWALHMSLKGDDLAVVDLVRSYGIPAGLTELGTANHGSLDLFRSLAVEDAIVGLTRIFRVLAPTEPMRAAAETHGLAMIDEEAATPQPSTRGVIERLLHHADPDAAALGRLLDTNSRTRLGSPLLGAGGGEEALPTSPGLWLVRVPGLNLPLAGRSPSSWDPEHRLSLAVVQATALHALAMANRSDLREMSKIVSIPEVHRLTGSDEGIDFLDQTARIGRALNTNLVFDTQDVAWLRKMPGIIEQLSTVFCFQLTSTAEQDAAAELLQLEPGPHSRQIVADIGYDTQPIEADTGKPLVDSGRRIRHGHAIMRDYMGRAGTAQFIIPNEEIRLTLSTNPDGQRLRQEFESAKARRDRQSSGDVAAGDDPSTFPTEPTATGDPQEVFS